MKYIPFFILILVTTAVFLGNIIFVSAVDPDLMVHWTFDETSGSNAWDLSGNGRNGIISSASFTSGQINGAYDFNGSSDYVFFSDFDPPIDVTLAAWIYPTASTYADRIIVNKHSQEYGLRIVDTTGYLAGNVNGTYLTDSSLDFTTAGNRDKWYHVAYTFNDTTNTHKLYRDGVEVATGTNDASIVNVASQFRVGRHSNFDFGSFLGKIDEVRLYSRTLSSADILTLYNEQPPTSSITSPTASATVSGTVSIQAPVTDNVGVANVQFQLDGSNLSTAVDTSNATSTTATLNWDTTTTTNGLHSLTAIATDTDGNATTSSSITVTVTGGISALIGHWKFSEGAWLTTADSSGNSRTGTLVSGPAWVTGRLGNGLFFDSINDYVEIDDFAAPTNLTIGAWIYPTADSMTSRIIVDKNNTEYDFRINDSGFLNATVGSVAITDSSFNFTDADKKNTWYYVAYTFDSVNDLHKLFRNGVEVASAANTASITDTTNKLRIGRHSQFNFGSFLGTIDEVRLYSRALDVSEILTLYNNEQPPTSSITSPTNNSNVSGTVSIQAPVTDNVGVANVQFQLDGSNLSTAVDTSNATSTTATLNWDTTTTTNGLHSLTAIATDTDGNVATSTAITVTVNTGGNNVTVAVDAGTTYQTMSGFGSTYRLFTDRHMFYSSGSCTVQADITIPNSQQEEILDKLYIDLGLTRTRPATGDCSIEPVNDNNDPDVTDLTKFDFATWPRHDLHVPFMENLVSIGLSTYFLSPIVLEQWMYTSWDPNNNTGTPDESATTVNEYVEWSMATIRRWRELGLDLPYYSIMNEPGFMRGGIWSGEFIRDAIKALGAKLRAENFTTMIVATDDFNSKEAYNRLQIILADADARQYIGAFAYHLYDPGLNAQELLDGKNNIKTFSDTYNIPIWMTEYSQSNAFEWADNMHELIYNRGVSAIDYMNSFLGAWETDTQLVKINADLGALTYTNYTLTKPYYVIGQYSRFIRPGAVRIDTSSDNTGIKVTAFNHTTDGTFTIVAINDSGISIPTTFNLSNTSISSIDTAYETTTAGNNWVTITSPTITSNSFTATLAANSVTTFVADSTAPPVTSVTASASSDSATITWTTNESSSSKVEYGISDSYGTLTSETNTSPRVFKHTVTLSDLTACTTYYYRVRSKDTQSNEKISSGGTFTTTGCVTESEGGGGMSGSGGLLRFPEITELNPEGTFRVVINNADEITGSKLVKLRLFGGPDVTQVSISNSPDFSGAIKEAYVEGKEWDLSEDSIDLEDGEHSVYVLLFNEKNRSTPIIKDSIIYKKGFVGSSEGQEGAATDVSTSEGGEDSPYVTKEELREEGLVRVVGDERVYIISKEGTMRHIPSPEVFQSYEYDWSDIKVVGSKLMLDYKEVHLISPVDNPKVYYLDNGIKRHIPNPEIFNSYGYDWSDIVEVNDTEFIFYRESNLIKAKDNPRVYELKNNTKYWIPNERIFNAKNLSWSNIVEVSEFEMGFYLTGDNSAQAHWVDHNPVTEELIKEFGAVNNTVAKNLTGNSDNTVTFGALWDEDNLYVAIGVLDNMLYDHKSSPWISDSVELFLDVKNNKSNNYEDDDARYIKEVGSPELISNQDITGVGHSWEFVNGGYIIRFNVPWFNLSFKPSVGAIIGFDVQNNDNDADFFSSLIWNGSGTNEQGTVDFGTLELVE